MDGGGKILGLIKILYLEIGMGGKESCFGWDGETHYIINRGNDIAVVQNIIL